ncbi:MAG TPA: DUF1207 domain-containing protein [Longimicrobiales bacterium]
MRNEPLRARTLAVAAVAGRTRAERFSSRVTSALPWLLFALLAAFPLCAQEAAPSRLLPEQRYFTDPIADLREPRFAVGLAWTDLFRRPPVEHPSFAFPDAEDAAVDVHGTAGMGATLPLWQLARWPQGGAILAVQAGVTARFRMEKPSRDHVATDWSVALPVEVAWNQLSGRLRLLHRSSHLGDELMQQTGAEHIEVSHEAVDFLVAYGLLSGTARIYGGSTFVFRSTTEEVPAFSLVGLRDDASLQVGMDGAWFPQSGGTVGLIGGFDWQRAQRTGWMNEVSAAAGVVVRNGSRSLQLVARYFRGPSPFGQFFLTSEQFLGLELVAGTSPFP